MNESDAHVDHHVNLTVLTGGRVLFSLGLVKAEPEAAANPILMVKIGAAEAEAEAVLELERRWQIVLVMSQSRGDAGPLDNAIDQAVGSINNAGLDRQKQTDPKSADGEALASFMLRFYSAGAVAITSLAYEDELVAVKRLVAALRGPDANIVEILGIGFYVRRLEELLPQFEAALKKAKPEDLAFGKLRAARASLQIKMKRVLNRILADFDGEDQGEVLGRLLAPIHQQEELVRRLRRANRPVTDVDRKTGDELTDVPASNAATSSDAPAVG